MKSALHKTCALIASIAAVALLTGVASSSDNTNTANVLIPYEEVVFNTPLKAGTMTVSGGPLREEPDTGSSSQLVKLTKGHTGRHSHTFDQQVVVVKGTLNLWEEGREGEALRALGPGSYWYEKRGTLHDDICVSEECILFVHIYANDDTTNPANRPK